MRFTSLAILIVLAVSGPQVSVSAEENEQATMELQVMSFNVRYGTASDGPSQWKHRKAHVCDLIRDAAPDVLGVQEGHGFQLEEILAEVPGYRVLGEKRQGPLGEEHSSIFYKEGRFTVDDWATFWLSDTPEKPSRSWGNTMNRICTWVRLVEKETGQGLYVFNTHFDHRSQNAREKSARLILRRIAERKHADPIILVGDFNAGEDNRAITYLQGQGRSDDDPQIRLVDSFRQLHPKATQVGTSNRFQLGNTQGSKIDYVFVQPSVKVLKATIDRSSRDGRYPSDHFPVTARLQIGTD